MNDRKILFICGSHNQTTMMHKISKHFSEDGCYITHYLDGFIKSLSKKPLGRMAALSDYKGVEDGGWKTW